MKLDRHDAHYVDQLLAAESSCQAILVESKQAELDDPEKRRSFELFRTGLRAGEVELLANIFPLVRTPDEQEAQTRAQQESNLAMACAIGKKAALTAFVLR